MATPGRRTNGGRLGDKRSKDLTFLRAQTRQGWTITPQSPSSKPPQASNSLKRLIGRKMRKKYDPIKVSPAWVVPGRSREYGGERECDLRRQRQVLVAASSSRAADPSSPQPPRHLSCLQEPSVDVVTLSTAQVARKIVNSCLFPHKHSPGKLCRDGIKRKMRKHNKVHLCIHPSDT